jgi:hypothetical protein
MNFISLIFSGKHQTLNCYSTQFSSSSILKRKKNAMMQKVYREMNGQELLFGILKEQEQEISVESVGCLFKI